MKHEAIVGDFKSFVSEYSNVLFIHDDESFQHALDVLETVINESNGEANDPLLPLIDMLSSAIERFESQDSDIVQFEKRASETPGSLALLRVLMDQHKLTGNDLPEIGGKSMVSRVLNGERKLTVEAIEKLSKRFGISAGMFLC